MSEHPLNNIEPLKVNVSSKKQATGMDKARVDFKFAPN